MKDFYAHTKTGRLTAEGRVLHERVHEAGAESRPDVRTVRGLRGAWRPFPVEFKRGKPKPDRCDEIQLCAQAVCLEEMLGAARQWWPHRIRAASGVHR